MSDESLEAPETVPYTPPWASAPWAHEMRRLFLEVVGHEEQVEFEPESDSSGKAVLKKGAGTAGTAFLDLRAPNGTIVRVAIAPDRLDEFLGLMMPGYVFTGE